MSVHTVYYKDGEKTKYLRPVLTRADYLALRNGGEQQAMVKAVRAGNEQMKSRLVQMNYSCLPNDDGSLKGSTRMSTTVGMDIDHVAAEEMEPLRARILAKKQELGLRMLELSARAAGYHLVFERRPELSQEGNLKWASELLDVKYDDGAKDITRVFFTTTGKPEDLVFLDDAIFEIEPCAPSVISSAPAVISSGVEKSQKSFPTVYHGIPFTTILKRYWELNNHGYEPTEGDRDTLTYQLACDLRHICGKNFDWLDQVIPCYDGFTQEEKREKIRNALSSEYNGFPLRLRNVLNSLATGQETAITDAGTEDGDDVAEADSSLFSLNSSLKKMPQGIKESIDAVGPDLALPVVTAISPCIGALATGVVLDVHGQKKGLNLIAYVAGDFASGKGSIDPVVEAWMAEVAAQDKLYQMQEDEWRAKKRAAKNKKEQPEEPKLPVRFLTLNNTVANLAERLANTDGKHAYSFTPEADTVAQKWKSAMSDFSVMLRQSYDGSKYDREARSADAVNVHIDRLLWNVTLCGTPDALYRVVSNYTDGFQSRIAVARTPDNTYAPLEDKPYVLTDRQTERIHQIAHLLMLMQGVVVLPKLEAKGREWLERIRLESIKSDDKVRARQRFRICVTTQRMTCCIMLCKVAEQLIAKHGFKGAEKLLKTRPDVWMPMLQKSQTPQLLQAFDVIADYLMDTALFFFRERIENAFSSREYAGMSDRRRMGRNDSIFARLEMDFGFDSALQQSIVVKGSGVSRNQVKQMLKNWKKQGLIVQTDTCRYRKVQEVCR